MYINDNNNLMRGICKYKYFKNTKNKSHHGPHQKLVLLSKVVGSIHTRGKENK